MKNTVSINFARSRVLTIACIGFVCLLLSACGTRPMSESALIQSAVKGDGPGSFRALGSSAALQVKDLPRSRSGNASVYTVFGKQYSVMDTASGFTQRGKASWYGKKFHGRDTASGEQYNMYDLTAAHKTLPLPVFVRVTNLDNGRELIVKVNDRGPFVDGRIIDLSFAAARELGVYETGTANVEIEALSEAYRPGDVPKVAAAPSPTQQPDARYGWVVQLGAFTDITNASNLRDRLGSDLGAQSSINHDVNAQLYRVLLGPLASSDEADQLLISLASAGIDGYTLKARIQ